MAFTEILAIIVLSYIAGAVSVVLFALNIATKKTNKKIKKAEEQQNKSTDVKEDSNNG